MTIGLWVACRSSVSLRLVKRVSSSFCDYGYQ